MEFPAHSDDQAVQLRGERTATLDQGRHVLVAALDPPGDDLERDPLLDQLADINAELACRWETSSETTQTTLQQRGYPDFDGKTDAELEYELGELAVSAGLSARGSPAYSLAVSRIRAIDKELSRRAEERGQ